MSEIRVRTRLSADERRTAVVETACRVFAKSSYRGSTTAMIARETGVTEPVLYRHFASKRELYLACLDAVWERVRALWNKALEREEEPSNWLRAIGKAYLGDIHAFAALDRDAHAQFTTMLDVFERIKLDEGLYRFRGHTRIAQIRHLLDTAQLDVDLLGVVPV